MKIYEFIRKKQAETRTIESIHNREVLEILKQWFPEYEVDYRFGNVTFKCCNDYWCRFHLYAAETHKYGDFLHKESAFRLFRNNGLSKEEIKSIKERLTKLYEGAYEDGI